MTGADPERLDGEISQLIALVDSMHPNPAYLLGPMTRILAWNRAASVVLGSPDHLAPERRYLLWWLMVDPGEGAMTAQREGTARNTLARFRAEYARHAGEPEYEEFLAHIRGHSAQFREWWNEHEVIEAQRGTKVMEHPQLGTLRLHHAQTVPTGQPELRLAVYAPADADTRAALATLCAGRRQRTARRRGIAIYLSRPVVTRGRWPADRPAGWRSRARRGLTRPVRCPPQPCFPRGAPPSWYRESGACARNGTTATRGRPA